MLSSYDNRNSNRVMTLNHRQRVCLAVAGCLLMATLIYPPFKVQGISLGFAWIFFPPHPYAVIDVGMLLVEWVALLLCVVTVIFFFGGRGATLSGHEAGVVVEKVGRRSLILVLRAVWMICGFVMALQIIGLLPIIGWLGNIDVITDQELITVALKVSVGVIAAAGFYGLRKLINRLQARPTVSDTAAH